MAKVGRNGYRNSERNGGRKSKLPKKSRNSELRARNLSNSDLRSSQSFKLAGVGESEEIADAWWRVEGPVRWIRA
ncbi:hypothetical protein CDL15_Pgr024829 [Punica granatum]|uniref:Uncharacterized protein n=1 Tax=Punica granatum TaxID=22663 RepID=A0A218WIX1_PUNGR|nr:hypothetical protein CDL15_Pgr024829 [Punica granatum]